MKTIRKSSGGLLSFLNFTSAAKANKAKANLLRHLTPSVYPILPLIDPNWQISPEIQLNRVNIQKLVNHCIQIIQIAQCTCIKTLQIQQIYLSTLLPKQVMVEAHKQKLRDSLLPLEEDILQYTFDDSSKYAEQRLIRRIVLYITIASGLGSPKHGLVLKEATYSFRSVYDDADIARFIKLSPEQKMQELIHVQSLVTGIRLFNRDCGKPCAEIEDLPRVLTQALDATKIELQNQLLMIMEKVNLTTSAVEHMFSLVKDPVLGYIVQKHLPEGISEETLYCVLSYLILARQHEVYIRKLLTDVLEIDKYSKELFNSLQKTYLKIHHLVKFKVAIPTSVVYPLFTELANAWTKIQDEAIVLSLYNHICQNVYEIVNKEKMDIEKIKQVIGSGNILTDAMRMERTMGLKIKEENNLCTVLHPSRIKDFDKIPLQYLGFCPWGLVETKGGLLPGNPNMGILQWKDKYYIFGSIEAAEVFGRNPDSYIMRALEITRQRPALINLLNLYDQLNAVKNVEVLYETPPEVILTKNQSMQTTIHPVKTNIDKTHVWNIWDYYRDAIKLANITCCLTHSAQTNYTHFRTPVRLQTINPKEKACQTKTDNYTNVATPSNFLFGVRGRKDGNQHIIDLTTPVDEDKYRTCATAMENPPDIKFIYETHKKKQHPKQKKPETPKAKSTTCTCHRQDSYSEPTLDDFSTVCKQYNLPQDEDQTSDIKPCHASMSTQT